MSNPLSKTGASTAPIIALAALALLTGGAAVARSLNRSIGGSRERLSDTGRRQRGHRMAVRRLGAVLLRAVLRGAMVQITVRPPLDAANDRVFGGLVRGRTAIRHHASGRAAVGAFVRRTLAGLSFLAAWLRRERSLWGNDGRNR